MSEQTPRAAVITDQVPALHPDRINPGALCTSAGAQKP
jgi:hypothetical protein